MHNFLSDPFFIFESIISIDLISQRNIIRKHFFKDSATELFNPVYSSISTLSSNSVDEHCILKNNNAHALFATVDGLTNGPVSVASELHSDKACNEFANLFTENTQKIRRILCPSIERMGTSNNDVSIKTNFDKVTKFYQIDYNFDRKLHIKFLLLLC
ncbi:hypothetical protein GOODEAATRI_029226 [Goodea atripinnis]|uniref:Uncharacterized protein n=1 Tax=Goodea atripinnis TaxID=208336 RepID=A0ABV0NSG5_9TELE